MSERVEGAGRSPAIMAMLGSAVLAGCVSYSPSQLSAMSTVDVCELQQMQGPNLSPQSKQAIRSELQRRNDSCGNHAIELAQRYESFMWREMYGRHDDP